jgi:G3E family GTPase
VEQYQLDVVKNIVAKINDQAKVYFTSYGRLADLDLLHLNTFAPETILRSSFAIQKKHNSTGHFSLSNQSIEPASLLLTKPRHQMVHSHSFRIEGALDFLKFDMWVNMMLNLNPEGIYRMKGILHIQDFEQKIIFQSVYTQHVCVGGGVWLDDEPKETLLVVIGKNLNREMLQRGLDQLLAK